MYAAQLVGLGYYSMYHLFHGTWEVGVMDDYGNIQPVALIPQQVFYFQQSSH